MGTKVTVTRKAEFYIDAPPEEAERMVRGFLPEQLVEMAETHHAQLTKTEEVVLSPCDEWKPPLYVGRESYFETQDDDGVVHKYVVYDHVGNMMSDEFFFGRVAGAIEDRQNVTKIVFCSKAFEYVCTKRKIVFMPKGEDHVFASFDR